MADPTRQSDESARAGGGPGIGRAVGDDAGLNDVNDSSNITRVGSSPGGGATGAATGGNVGGGGATGLAGGNLMPGAPGTEGPPADLPPEPVLGGNANSATNASPDGPTGDTVGGNAAGAYGRRVGESASGTNERAGG